MKEMDVFTNEKARLENTIPDITLKEIKEVASFKRDSHSISTLSLYGMGNFLKIVDTATGSVDATIAPKSNA
jgi:ribosomal protein L11